MQPCKKAKVEQPLSLDPFADEDDWDNDDSILQLVADDAPTGSQISQVLKSSPLLSAGTASLSSTNKNSSKPRNFVFKRPTAGSASALSMKPASYTNNDTSDNVLDLVNATEILPKSKSPNVLATESLPKLVKTAGGDSGKDTMLSDLIRKQHAHEGEIQWLRTALKQKDDLVNTVRTNFNAEKAKQRLQHSEKERQFVKDVETLRLELQFKESELMAVTQAMDKLKRDLSRTAPPFLKLDSDGFPASCQSPRNVRVIEQPKVEPTETFGNAQMMCKNDLRPLDEDRLIPRRLCPKRYKKGLAISEMLSCIEDESSCQELALAIECAKDLCYT